MKIQLIDSNQERVTQLKQMLIDLHSLEVVGVQRAVYTLPPGGLDMMFFTLPAAERWHPDFRSHDAQILATTCDDQRKGFPPLIITGFNLAPEDPKDSLSQVCMILNRVLSAARSYNDQNSGVIKTLGFWVMDLTRGVTAEELSQLLHKELMPE